MRIDIWSDIVCPWCYIGKRRFERALESFPHRANVEIVYHSFQLDPYSVPGQTRNHRDNLMSKYGMSQAQADAAQVNLERTAADEGLEFHLVGGVTGNTFDAHRVLHLAKAHGLQDATVERLFRAHFTEQRSIFDHDSLTTLAGDAGLAAADVRDVLSNGRYGDAVRADNDEARTLGATGVPFFVIDNRYGVSGAQATTVFAQALERAWADHESRPSDSEPT